MNSGKPIKLNLNKLTIEEKKKYATEFSEGSVALNNLLLKLWDNGIETIACCAGHEKPSGILKIQSPYISFCIDKFSTEDLRRIVSRIISGYNKKLLGFAFQISKDKIAKILVRTYDLELMKKFFLLMDDIIFNQVDFDYSKLSIQDKEIVESILNMFELSIDKQLRKSKKSPTCQYAHVAVLTFGDNSKIKLLTHDNCIKKSIGKQFSSVYRMAEGFYIKVGETKYYTLRNNKVLRLFKEDLRKYKKLRTYKKYNSVRDFNISEMKQVLDEIKSYQ